MTGSGQGRRRTAVAATVVLGFLLAALMVYPWPQHQAEPIIAGVIPAPLLFWILWTALFVGYVAWIAYRWDPYAAVVRRARGGQAEAPEAVTGSGEPTREEGQD